MQCLLFGELRSLMGNSDYVEVIVQSSSGDEDETASRNGVVVTPQVLWQSIAAALSSAADRMQMHEARRHQLEGVFSISQLAINDEFVDASDSVTVISRRAVRNLAVIPPVSGG